MWKHRLLPLAAGLVGLSVGLAGVFLRAQLNDRLPHLSAALVVGPPTVAGIVLYFRHIRRRSIASTGCKPADLLLSAHVQPAAKNQSGNNDFNRVFHKGGQLFVFVSGGRLAAYGVPVEGETEQITLAARPLLEVFECGRSIAETRFPSDGGFGANSLIRRGPAFRRIRA